MKPETASSIYNASSRLDGVVDIVAVFSRWLPESFDEERGHVLDGVESGIGCDLLQREVSVRDEKSDSLHLNFTDRDVNGVAQHSREPGFQPGARDRHFIHDIRHLDAIERMFLDEGHRLRHLGVLDGKDICRSPGHNAYRIYDDLSLSRLLPSHYLIE